MLLDRRSSMVTTNRRDVVLSSARARRFRDENTWLFGSSPSVHSRDSILRESREVDHAYEPTNPLTSSRFFFSFGLFQQTSA